MARRRERSQGSWLQLFSFAAVMLLALALLLTVVNSKAELGLGQVIGWINNIAIALAVVVPCVLSYREARRQGTVWFVLWVIAIILVVACYVLSIF